jgi:FKBP-type peptidyl-prolyl cis-trans isomerase
MKNQKENIGFIVSSVAIVVVIGLVIYILMNRNQDIISNSSENKISNSIVSNDNKLEEQVKPTKNNMEKVSKNGDVLVMNYTGRFTDGKVFDSNVDPKFSHVSPFEFTLGAGMVIKGWDEGLVGMKIGEKKVLTVPPEKGYGPNDYNGIPGNSTLIFDVELLDIK